MFDIKTSQQVGSIEGRNDLGSGVSKSDLITAKKNLQGKYVSRMICHYLSVQTILTNSSRMLQIFLHNCLFR